MLMAATVMTAGSCGGKGGEQHQEQVEEESDTTVIVTVNRDSTVYGICIDGSAMNTLQLPSPLTTRVRIRISSLGTTANYLYLDDFVFYARQRVRTLSDYSSSCRPATTDIPVQGVQGGGQSGTAQKIISNGRLLITGGGTVRDILGRPVRESATLELPLSYP